MKDAVDALDRLCARPRIQQVPAQVLDAVGPPGMGWGWIQDPHAHPGAGQGADHLVANEAGASGDQGVLRQ